MTKKLKKRLVRVLVGSAVFIGALLLEHFGSEWNPNYILIAFLAAYLIIGGDVVKQAARNIIKGQVFDENFLMSIATIGAFFVSQYPEAVAVMLFYQVGELFQSYAVNRSRKSIADLMDIRPDCAYVKRDGEVVEVDPEEVAIGDVIVIKPGEKVPLDGVVLVGNTTLDTMALTGESVPREVLQGESVISGCINLTGLIEVQVSHEFGESTVSKILDLVENASSKKAEAENFITKFARYYTPAVVIAALLLAIVPPLVQGGDWYNWIYRALNFLVISCPCALVISIPLSFFGGLGGASRQGVLIKGSNYLEALASAEIIVMDKTGTLTKGSFEVTRIVPATKTEQDKTEQNDTEQDNTGENKGVHADNVSREVISTDELLKLTALVESYSNHPISNSLRKAYEKLGGSLSEAGSVSDVNEIAGHGVSAMVNGQMVYAGNSKLMKQIGVAYCDADEIGTIVHVAREQEYLGHILIADEIKEDARKAMNDFKAVGIRKTVMLTGDRKETAKYVAEQIGVNEYYSELLPGDKVDRMEGLLQSKSEKGKLLFVGDGINDAPVLARADVGIAMGGLGSDAAIEAADIVIMTDEPSKIALAIRISHKTLRIVKENIIFALGIKAAILILAAFGIATMWAAVFADVGVAFLAILNAMRSARIRK